MLQSFVLQAGDQHLLFSGGPVWLQLGTAFATWRGRDIPSVTRVTPNLDTHSLAGAHLWGTRFTPQVRMGFCQLESPQLPPVKAAAQELHTPDACHESFPGADPRSDALLRALGSRVHISSPSHA